MSRRALPPPAADRREGVRGALLHTLPGRAIVVGLGVKIAVGIVGLALGRVPQFFAVVDTVAGVAAACGLAYFAFRLIVLAKRRLLWRVRRKLILSYVFIGFVPALLLVAFSLLCGFLLFYSFSSYLVQSRLRALSEQARFLAQSAALEIQRAGGRDAAGILALRQANAAREYPEASMAVVPVSRACGGPGTSSLASPVLVVRLQTSGPWSHVDPPEAIPSWIGCDGFTGVLAYSHRRTVDSPAEDTHLMVRSVAFPDAPRTSYAVVVDLLVNDAIRQQLRKDTGVELKSVTAVPQRKDDDARPLTGRGGGDERRGAPPASPGLLSSLTSFIDYHDWSTGASGPMSVTSALSVPELYDRISAAEGSVGRTLGQGLLIVLFAIGALFLIIEAMALIAGFALAKSLTGSVHALFAGTERVRQGDFTHKIAVRSEDQLGEDRKS